MPAFSPAHCVEGVRPLALHHRLVGQREGHPVVELAEAGDLARRARLLAAEIIGRHADDHQALVPVGLPQCLEPLILRGVAAFGRRVDHQHELPLELRQRHGHAVDACEREIMGSDGHGVISECGR